MNTIKYQLSKNLRLIHDYHSGVAVAYHTLYGNPHVINHEAGAFMELFHEAVTLEDIAQQCDDDPLPILRQFVDMFFITQVGVDERAIVEKRKNDHLHRVSSGLVVDRMGLAISDSCNFACTHCLHMKSINHNRSVSPLYGKTIPQLKMTWVTAKKCVDTYVALMRKNGLTNCRVHFGNAEPLTNWPVLKNVLEYCTNIPGMTFDFAINTNLTLVTKEIAVTLKTYRVRIATSLDGLEEANDAIRVTPGGHGTFKRILEKFDLLDEIGYPLDGFSFHLEDGGNPPPSRRVTFRANMIA